MLAVILNSFNQAVDRQHFRRLKDLRVWLTGNYPDLDRLGYTLEIFYD